MVLADLGNRISAALRTMSNATVIDETVLNEMLKEIGNALIKADVSVKLVMNLRGNIKNRIPLDDMAAGVNKRKLIQKTVFDELCDLLDPGKKPYKPAKGKPNVIMTVGLQGSGKTTSVAKLAYYYKRKGWKPCMVCADTFRAGAFDQLKQNATKAKIPFYGSYTEADPAKIAGDGVEKFKDDGHDIIIVDTSGRHKQEKELFVEMQEISAAVKPDEIIFVMDGSIGQAAYEQAKAFKEAVGVGSVIITKLDGHAKGGGALSAVAATESPIVFLGTGEYLDDLEKFETEAFVGRLLGMGDMGGMIEMLKEVIPKDEAPELAKRFQEGIFTLRDMYDQFQNIMKMGPLGKVMEMIPGMSQMLGNLPKGVDSSAKLKAYLNIMDSMTDDELDNPSATLYAKKEQQNSRINRIARGSGRSAKEVNELLVQHRQFEKMVQKMGKLNPKARNMNQQMANMVPPHLMKQMGGFGGFSNMMKQLGNMDLKDLGM